MHTIAVLLFHWCGLNQQFRHKVVSIYRLSAEVAPRYLIIISFNCHLRLVSTPDQVWRLEGPLGLEPEQGQLLSDHSGDLLLAQARAAAPCGLVPNGRQGTLENTEAGDQLPGPAALPGALDVLPFPQLCLMARTAPEPPSHLTKWVGQNIEPLGLGPKVIILDRLPDCLCMATVLAAELAAVVQGCPWLCGLAPPGGSGLQ